MAAFPPLDRQRVFIHALQVWYEGPRLASVWKAIFPQTVIVGKGKTEERTVEIFDVETDQCPVGFITPRSNQLIQILGRAHNAREMAQQPFGKASTWDAAFYDAVVLIEEQRMIEDRAIQKAVHG